MSDDRAEKMTSAFIKIRTERSVLSANFKTEEIDKEFVISVRKK